METTDVSSNAEIKGNEPTKEAETTSEPPKEIVSKTSEVTVKENGHQDGLTVGKKSPRDFQKLDQTKMSRSTSHKFCKSSPSEKKGSSDIWSRVTGSDGTENLPGYALPTVAFQLRVSLCQSADGLTEQSLPVCQRYRSDSPNALSNFIKEQRSKSAENRRNQMEKMIELSQPTSRRSKYNATIPTSTSNHTSASDSSTPHSGRSSKSPGKSLNKKSSLDDSLIGRKSKGKNETTSVQSTPDGKSLKKLKKKTSSLDVLATPRSKESRQPSASRQSPAKPSPASSKGTHSRDSSVHQQKPTKPKSEIAPKQNGSPEKGKDKKPKDLKEKKVDSSDTSGKPDENKKETEEYRAKLAEKRKQAREKAEKEAEEEKKKQEELRIAEEEKQKKEEEEEKKREEEEMRLAEESRKAEEERLQKMIAEEDERKKKEAEKLEKELQVKKEQENKAKAEAEKMEQERLVKIKKDEEEKLERKKRLENIMKRVKPDEASDKKASLSSTVTNGLPESHSSAAQPMKTEGDAEDANTDENTKDATNEMDGAPNDLTKSSDDMSVEAQDKENATAVTSGSEHEDNFSLEASDIHAANENPSGSS